MVNRSRTYLAPHFWILSGFCVGLVCLSGCSKEFSREAAIKQIIRGAKSSISKTKAANPMFASIDVYRDKADKNGVVYEYRLASGYEIDPSLIDRNDLIQGLRSEFVKDKSSKRLKGLEIFFRFVYLNSDGSTAKDIRVECDELF